MSRRLSTIFVFGFLSREASAILLNLGIDLIFGHFIVVLLMINMLRICTDLMEQVWFNLDGF